MKITFRMYNRPARGPMLYINRSNGVSVGITPEHGWAPYGKHVTQGQRNAVAAAIAAARAHGVPFTGDLAQHREGGFCAPVVCGPFIMVGTDVAEVGGMKVGSDGLYVIFDGLILPAGYSLAEPEIIDASAE